MQYIVEGTIFDWSYSELRQGYHHFITLSDDEFLADLPAILHFACFVCFVKEIPNSVCLSDKGIIHELVHILQSGIDGSVTRLSEIRQLFEEQLKLA